MGLVIVALVVALVGVARNYAIRKSEEIAALDEEVQSAFRGGGGGGGGGMTSLELKMS